MAPILAVVVLHCHQFCISAHFPFLWCSFESIQCVVQFPYDSWLFQAQVNEDDYTELNKKCRKYNKLIHKLREKIVQLENSAEKLRVEKAALARDLSDIQLRHKQFGAVFTQLEETEKMKEVKSEKMEAIDDMKKSIDELDKKSSEYLEKQAES